MSDHSQPNNQAYQGLNSEFFCLHYRRDNESRPTRQNNTESMNSSTGKNKHAFLLSGTHHCHLIVFAHIQRSRSILRFSFLTNYLIIKNTAIGDSSFNSFHCATVPTQCCGNDITFVRQYWHSLIANDVPGVISLTIRKFFIFQFIVHTSLFRQYSRRLSFALMDAHSVIEHWVTDFSFRHALVS